MGVAFQIIVWIVVVCIALPLCIVAMETWFAQLPSRKLPLGVRPPVAVLVPAHNEELGLARTLQDLVPQLLAGDALVVIADNCEDRTAVIARSFPRVQVVERRNLVDRGKGFALAEGLNCLAANPPEVVVFIDADSRVARDAVDLLSRVVSATSRPVQASNVISPASEDANSPIQSISAFAFNVRNFVRARGRARLGGGSFLTGNGMAIPWKALQQVSLATGDIVEDLNLGIALASKGFLPLFLESAHITSELAPRGGSSLQQRRRWEHGHLAAILNQVPRLLSASIAQRSLSAGFLAISLAVPPLALLAVLSLALLAACLLATCAGYSMKPALVLGAALFPAALGVFMAWVRWGRDQLTLIQALSLPFYILWKLPIYVRFVTQRENTWVRSERSKNL